MKQIDLSLVPNVPGVYFMLGAGGEILYIGKAKRLRKRLASYRCVGPTTHPPHLVELTRLIQEVRWETFRAERLASARESELLHAVRPPYNTADTEPGTYLFVTVRKLVLPRPAARGADSKPCLELVLTSEPLEGGTVFGCYRNRPKIQRGFAAMLRLIFAASFAGPRFAIPARLARSRLAAAYRLVVPDFAMAELSRFLRGESLLLLRQLSLRLIENEAVPRFMGPSLQDDLELAREFFRVGPRATRLLKRRGGFRSGVLLHDQMDALIRRTLPSFVSEQPLNSAKS